MDFHVRISAPALIDFEDILEYSSANFPANAERFGYAILDHVDLLRTFPYMGSPVAGRFGVRQLIPYSNRDLLPRPRRPQCGEDSPFLARLTKRPCLSAAVLAVNGLRFRFDEGDCTECSGADSQSRIRGVFQRCDSTILERSVAESVGLAGKCATSSSSTRGLELIHGYLTKAVEVLSRETEALRRGFGDRRARGPATSCSLP